ncbi:MAG TPA: hypothetical protein VHO25_03255 [Polyangiaceae bacterium]|nr:hypothetical protein [Polyangiaceae bacterium]
MLSWLLGKRFEPPTPPLRDYWLTIHVRLHEPLAVEGQGPSVGYLRVFGVRCTPLHLHSFVEENATDGSVEWSQSESATIDINDLKRSLRNQLNPPNAECLWHQSGRIFFPEEEPSKSEVGAG